MQQQILNAKSGIFNHAADDICDDPCLSKFGALHGLYPQIIRQFKNFRVALLPLLNKT